MRSRDHFLKDLATLGRNHSHALRSRLFSALDMDEYRTKIKLSRGGDFQSLPPDVREDLLNQVCQLVADRFSHLPEAEQLRIGGKALTWLTWRARRRIQTEARHAAQYALQHQADPELQDPAHLAEAEQARGELRQAIHDALVRELSPEERLVVLRRFVQEVPVAGVAAELGVNEQRVYYISRRALHVLRRSLSGLRELLD